MLIWIFIVDFEHKFVCWIVVILALFLLFEKCPRGGISFHESSAANKYKFVMKHEELIKTDALLSKYDTETKDSPAGDVI